MEGTVTNPGGALPSAAARHRAHFGRKHFWGLPAACLLLAVCFTTGSGCAGSHVKANLPAQGCRRAAGTPGQATCGPGSPCPLPFRPFAALRGGGGGGGVESSIPPPPSYSMMPSPSSIPPPPPMYEGSGTRSPARVRDERSSYTPGPLKDRAKTPSPRTKLTPPSKLRARSRTPVSTAKGKGKDPARAATALGDKRASPWPKEEFTPLKEKELTLPPPTMSPPPLPGLTPPPALDAGGRSRHSFQMDSLVVSSPKPLDSPAAGDPMSEQQSATPSDIASVDGRTALSEAEAALERAILGKEPVTAGHFHGLLAALVHVAQQGRASFDDARSVLEQMRTLRVPVDVPALRSALDVLAIDVARGKAEVCDGEALVQDLLKAGNVVRLGLPVFRAMLRVLAAGAGRGCAAPRDSERVVALMQEHECECDVATYNLMLDVVARSARCGRAEVADGVNVLYKIKKAGLTPDVNTFRSLMDVVAWSARRGRASMQDAEMVLREMVGSGRQATVGTFNGLMAVLAGQNFSKVLHIVALYSKLY